MSYLPSIVEAQHVNNHVLTVKFDSGVEKSVDISQWFVGPVFEPLKDLSYFKKFFIEAGTLCWSNGVDISPETLYQASEVQKAA